MFHSSLVLLVTALAGLAQAQHLTFSDPTLTTNDSFGYSVALDEQYLLVGAPDDDTIGLDVGQAHLYSLMTGELAHTFNDPTPIIVDNFGAAVALNGNHVLIGANRHGGGVGQVHLFNARTGAFLQTFDDPTPTNFDHFGTSLAIDGNYVLVGAPGDDSNGFENGQAYLFDVATGGATAHL